MKKILLVSSLVFALGGCGDEDTNSVGKSSSAKKMVANVVDSRFSKFMNLEKVCDILSAEDVQLAFNTKAEIEIKPASRSYGGRFTCNYSWPRADAKKREDQMITQMMDQLKKKSKKTPMRQRVMDHTFSLSLSEYNGSAAAFVPAKLTEEQLNQRIKAAQKAAAKRLTKEQKTLAGKAADDMIVRMMKKSNQNEKIEGIANAAFWEVLGQGALNVLEGNTKITVAPMIGDTKAADIENAKKIVNLIIAN